MPFKRKLPDHKVTEIAIFRSVESVLVEKVNLELTSTERLLYSSFWPLSKINRPVESL